MQIARRIGPWVWGVAVAGWLCHPFLAYGPGEMHANHEEYRYVQRIVEFLDCLRAGYLAPEWAVHFRGGLGSPYFAYYPPGFFYVAGLLAALLPVERAQAVAVWIFALTGFGGAFALVRARFGVAGGLLAGTTLLLAPYTRVDLYLRGDLAEYAGMMLLAALLHWLTAWLDTGRRAYWYALALGAGFLPALHPVAGLAGYGALAVLALVWAAMGAERRRVAGAAAALATGAALAAFYWLPLVLQWNLVHGERATQPPFDFRRYFIDVGALLGRQGKSYVPLTLGPVVPVLVAVSGALTLRGRRTLAPAAWHLAIALWVLAAGTVLLMTRASQPLWEALPLLSFLQFPWRLLLVLTVTLAALAGCVPMWRPVVAMAGVAALAWTALGAEPVRVERHPYPSTAGDLVTEWVAPDTAQEWLPRGSARFGPHGAARPPWCTPPCTAGPLERTAGRLRVRVETPGPTTLGLPHYYFPVGWSATLDGTPVPLERDAEGLMAVPVARSGIVEVRFATTPGRRLGLLVTVAVLALLLASSRRRRPLPCAGLTGRHALRQ